MLDQIRAESGDTVIVLARLCLRHGKIMDRLNIDMLRVKPDQRLAWTTYELSEKRSGNIRN